MTDTAMVEALAPTDGKFAAPANPDMRWYVVHAYSGMEKAVERNIMERVVRAGVEPKFCADHFSSPPLPLWGP